MTVHDVSEVDEEWADTLTNLEDLRAASRGPGDGWPGAAGKRRAAGSSTPGRGWPTSSTRVRSARSARWSAATSRPTARRRRGHDRRAAGDGRRRGLHDPRRHDRRWQHAKRYRPAELALRERVPLVMLLEGAGARAGSHGGRSPTDLIVQAQCSGRVPVVSAVMGASAGHGALIVPMSDFSVMTADAAVFTAGPPVVKESLGEEITKEELGGPRVAIPSGLINNLAPDDAAALDVIRDYLSYFPSSAWSYPPPSRHGDGAGRARAAPTSCSRSCRATRGRSTTCATSSTWSSTTARGSRSSPGSAAR